MAADDTRALVKLYRIEESLDEVRSFRVVSVTFVQSHVLLPHHISNYQVTALSDLRATAIIAD